MKKNSIAVVIIFLAVAIILVNLWKSFELNEQQTITGRDNSTINNEQKSEEKTIKGVDLAEVQEGKIPPDFQLNTLNGNTVKLSDYRGKKVILNFWATWCPPCKAEMPHMQNFYEKNKENGIEILAVNLTSMDNGVEAIQEFKNSYGLTFTIPLDETGDLGIQYQAFTIPTSYIIDTNGVISKKIVGPMDEQTMEALISEIP
nr:TlpA disulfide reductase family protein [Metabacillus malikii]